MPSAIASEIVEGPPEEIRALLNVDEYGNNADGHENDESSSLTSNSCDRWDNYPRWPNYPPPFAPALPLPPLPPGQDRDDPIALATPIEDEEPSSTTRTPSRRMSCSLYLGISMLLLSLVVVATPSFCDTVGNDHTSFCSLVWSRETEDLEDASNEAKLTNYLSSISLGPNVDKSLVKAIIRRGDVELPWDADRIRQFYALGTLLGVDFVEFEDECTVNDSYSIVCDEDGMVSELSLSGAALQAPLPDDIGLLSSRLRVLEVQGSQLTGTLPPQALSVLTKLVYLDLSNNSISGEIPETLGALKQLSHLNLSGNRLQGQVPSRLCDLTLLQVLHLAQNRLTGSFPMCSWENMEAIFLDGNQFTGPIPSSMGKWSNLKEINLSSNGFTGSLPGSWIGLTNLEVFKLNENKIDGHFPEMFFHWPHVQVLDVSGNSIVGTIPPEVCRLNKLEYFFTSKTKLTGTLPDCIGSWTKLQSFDISRTSIQGTLPSEIGRWVDLKSFSVARTLISGEIPNEITEWKEIENAWFDGTDLQGDMPLCTLVAQTSRGRGRNLDSLGADCNHVHCPCCRVCY